ncbi:MAG: hypothetical protein GY749_04485 [Desulfobacteraceae bacterium]|nr:hypothetical protein [Desulfobacteraceae bacterium]
MQYKKHLLDEDAEKLFRELGGIDTRSRILSPDHPLYRHTEDVEKLDKWRILMIDLLDFLASYFLDIRLFEGAKTEKESFFEFADTFSKLSRMPHDGTILIRYRGSPTGTSLPAKNDYVVVFGNLTVEASVVANMYKRIGAKASHLPGRLRKSFEQLAVQGIDTLFLEVPEFDSAESSEDELKRMELALSILSRYNSALKSNSPIAFEKKGKQHNISIAHDQNGDTDVNLTMVAGINSLSAKAMQSLVRKVDTWMNSDSAASAGVQYPSIYNAIFDIRSLKKKLIQPPVEVNNVKWMMAEKNQEVVTKEKAQVAKLVMAKFAKSPQKAGQVLQSVYAADYNKINSQHLGKRLHLASGLLASIEQKKTEEQPAEKAAQASEIKEQPEKTAENKKAEAHEKQQEKVKNEVLANVQERFKQVKEDVVDDLVVEQNVLKVKSGEKETVIGKVHEKFQRMIDVTKRRHATKKKMKDIIRRSTDFDESDYEILASDFDISVQDAKSLISLLQKCFDDKGHFLRGNFERNIPEFAKYEKRVFDFLWHYLKETFHRHDRVAFLNSLQLLIARMRQPKRAIRVLLIDLLLDPSAVNFPDRNALMLINLLLRKYNKELNLDIEITPEEVLLVKEGIDTDVVAATKIMVDGVQGRFFEKIKTIHRKLVESLDPKKKDEKGLPLRYLFTLEREIYIFFSLLSGNTALPVLRGAIKEYGDPRSRIYKLKESRNNLSFLLQNLIVLIRGLGRVGENEDLSRLEHVSWEEAVFHRLSEGTRHEEKLRRAMEWIGSAKETIVQNSWKDTKDTGGFEIMSTGFQNF